MKQFKILCLFLLSSVACFNASASKENLAQGWEAFNKNKRDDAIKLFEQAAKDADTKADGNLALSLVYWSLDKNDKAFKYFTEFFNSSDNPYPYVYALWTTPSVFDGYGRKNEAELKFLNALADDKKANGTIKAMVHSMLGNHYESVGNFKKAKEEFEAIGTLDNWAVLGTFDNTSGSGFNKDFGALANAGPDAVFKNKVNADVKWTTPPYARNDHWFDFDNYFVIDYSIMYAQTFLESDVDQEVFMRTGNSGSLKVWVNDKLVTNVSEERNCDLDIYVNNVKLNKGYNRVLVQIGESETDRANFMIRITDKDGNPIKGLRSTSAVQTYNKATEYTVTSYALFAEEFFENKAKNEPASLLNQLLLAETYMRNDKVYEARKALKKAGELAPESSFLGVRMIEAYARDKNVTDLTKQYEKIKSNDPDYIYAVKGLMDEADEKEDYDEEETLLEKYKKLYGEDEYSDLRTLALLAKRNKYEQVVSMSQSLYEKYPDNYELMAIMYSIERNTSKNLSKANQILKNYFKGHYSDKVLTAMASNYFDLGNKDEGLKLYYQRVDNYPYAISYYTDLSDLFFGAQDYSSALTWANKALDLSPYLGGSWNRLGKIYQAMNNETEAKEAFRKAIYYTPTNYEARKQLRKLEGKKDLFENFDKTDAYDLYKKAPKAEDYPDDNSIILLNETQRVVYPEGATEEKSEIVVKVFNQAGIDTWKEYYIGFNGYRQRLIIDKAEVLKKDGNKVQAEKDDADIVFTNLEAGDAIHLSYRIENYNRGKLAQHFWEQFNFNFSYPVLISRYSILMPATKEFKHQVLNADIKAKTTDVEDMKLYVWEMKDQPAIKPEPQMPPLSDIGAVLDISTLPDWKYVSNWYSDLSSTLAKTDFVIKETVAELFKDKKGLTELQKAKMIYEYIEQNVSYSNVPFMHGPIIPQKASRTLTTKLGDCKDVSTLFVAMCKEAGLKANLILVDTRNNGDKHLNLPSIDFNHCIAQLQTGGKNYIIELTDQKLSFAALPKEDLNTNALFIPREGDSAATQLMKLNSPSRVRNLIVRETDLKFENNDIIFTRKTIKTGVLASGVRNDFADEGKDKQEKEMTQAVAGDFTNPAKLLNLNFKDLKTLSDSVEYSYSFQVKNELNEVIGIKIFRIPWSEGVRTSDFLSLETRKYPLLMWRMQSAESFKETINIELPAGKVLAEQPKSVNITSDFADYTLTYNTSVAGKVKATREIKFKRDIVNADEYPKFREFYNQVAAADSKQIGFK